MARYLSRADLSHIAGKYIDQYYIGWVSGVTTAFPPKNRT